MKFVRGSVIKRASIARGGEEHVFPSETAALQGLFAAASRSKRSNQIVFAGDRSFGRRIAFHRAQRTRQGWPWGPVAPRMQACHSAEDRLRKAAPKHFTKALSQALAIATPGSSGQGCQPQESQTGQPRGPKRPRADVHMVWKTGSYR